MNDLLSEPFDRRAARKGDLDGDFLIGSSALGTYNLPSCKVAVGRKTGLLTFPSEAMARAAGLKPCKVCRPDRFYATRGDGLAVFNDLAQTLVSAPASMGSVAALAMRVGLTVPRLAVLLGDHAHLQPEAWLVRERVRFAASRLLGTKESLGDIAVASGFADLASFASGFEHRMCLTASEYRDLGRRKTFHLRLPPDYRTSEVLRYQGRDPEGLAERSDDHRIWKALSTEDGPAVVEVRFEGSAALVSVSATRKLGRSSYAKLHGDVLKILGLGTDIAAFERAHPALVAHRKGLRVPLIPSSFDALCWAIIGQQINLSFAGSLRRDLILLSGKRVGDMIVHPTPEAVANLEPAALTTRRFSRSKAKYLTEAARAIVSGSLDIEHLVDGSAVEAESLLTAQHGIGTWTARYVMMRTGFADAAPVGDSGLATALERMYGLAERPDTIGTARLMAQYSPWRSLASMHLWSSL